MYFLNAYLVLIIIIIITIIIIFVIITIIIIIISYLCFSKVYSRTGTAVKFI